MSVVTGEMSGVEGCPAQQGCYNQIRVFSVGGFGNEACDFKKMIDVGLLRCALSSLMNMPTRRSIGSSECLSENILNHRNHL